MKDIIRNAVFLFFLASLFSQSRIMLSKQKTIPRDWKFSKVPDDNQKHSFVILLPQKNTDVLESVLTKTSDPESRYYGEWLDKKSIDKIVFSDKKEFYIYTKMAVSRKSKSSECSKTSDSIYCTTTVKKINNIFKTRIPGI